MSRQSKYALRMSKLSSKIFNDYIKPEMPHEISERVMVDPMQRHAWESFHFHNAGVVQRSAARPAEFDTYRNPNYYPGHPQIRALMHTLREHGLYRDEHRDIKEEMKRMRALRGKPDKVWKGKNSGKKDPNQSQN